MALGVIVEVGEYVRQLPLRFSDEIRHFSSTPTAGFHSEDESGGNQLLPLAKGLLLGETIATAIDLDSRKFVRIV